MKFEAGYEGTPEGPMRLVLQKMFRRVVRRRRRQRRPAALSLLYTRSYTYNVAQIGLLEPPGFQFGFPGGPLSPRFSFGSIVM